MTTPEHWAEMNEAGQRSAEDGRLDAAAVAWQQVIDGGDPDATPIAAEFLGSLRLFYDDREDEAEVAYGRAIASGHPQATPRALAGLAELRCRQAQAAFDRARPREWRRLREEAASLVARAAATRAPADLRAADLLAIALVHLGRLEEAAALYDEMKHDPKRGADALVGLGWIRWKQGQADEAKALWRQAIEGGEARWVARAAYEMGRLLQVEGKSQEARDAYRFAAQAGDAEFAKDAEGALLSLSRPRSLARTFLPVAVFLPLFVLPHGWPQGLGWLLVGCSVFLLPGFRASARQVVLWHVLLPIAIILMAILEFVYGSAAWPTPVLIGAAILVVVMTVAYALPAWLRATMNRRTTS